MAHKASKRISPASVHLAFAAAYLDQIKSDKANGRDADFNWLEQKRRDHQWALVDIRRARPV